MKIKEVGRPRVCLSYDLSCDGGPSETGFVTVNVPMKLEDRAEDDGPIIGHAHPQRGAPLQGKTLGGRSSSGWLLFRIPRQLCPDGGSLTLRALADDDVLWEREYRVVWQGRYPGLEALA